MIGNDVIDLELAAKESNWKRKGFLEKIFTANEQLFIKSSDNPELKVWELWSRKEAAYKIFNRNSGVRLFNPIQFECTTEEEFERVIFEDLVFFTKSMMDETAIYTIALEQKSDFNKIVFLKSRDGIIKKNGIPSKDGKPVSISHHGRFEQIVSILQS